MELTKSTLAVWKSDPVTKEIMHRLRLAVEEETVSLAVGSTVHEEPGATAQDTAYSVGKIKGLQWLLELESDEIEDKRTGVI